MVPMLSPDGQLGDIPQERMTDALKGGFKIAVSMTSPDGKAGYIPHDQVGAAQQSGFKVDTSDKTTEQPGFFESMGRELWGIAKSAPSVLHIFRPDYAVEMAQKADQMQQADEARQQAGRSLPYRAAATVGEGMGIANATGMEQAAAQGNTAGVAGIAAGDVAPVAAAEGARAAVPKIVAAGERATLLGRTPEGAYESALKPSTTIPAAKRAAIVQTGLEQEIPVTAKGVEAVGQLIDDYNTQIKAHIEGGTRQGVTIDPNAVAERIADVKTRFANQVNPEADLSAIDASKAEFLRNNPNPIPAADAQAMKQGTYRTLGERAYQRKFTGAPESATDAAQKALARGLKEELATQFPELGQLNATEGRLLDLQPVLEKAVNRISNHQLMGIGTPIAAGAVKAVTGSGKLGAVAGVMKAVLDNPAVKSRLAISLNHAGVPLAAANARIASYGGALAAAAARETAPSDTSDQSPNQ